VLIQQPIDCSEEQNISNSSLLLLLWGISSAEAGPRSSNVATKLYKASQLKIRIYFNLSCYSDLTPRSFQLPQSKLAETQTFWACLKACEESEHPISPTCWIPALAACQNRIEKNGIWI